MPSSPDPPSPPSSSSTPPAVCAVSPAHAWAIAIVATLVMAVSYVDRQSFAALSPTICGSLGIDHAEYGWLTAAFSIAYLVGAPLAGWLVDRTGARRGLMGSVLVWSLVAALHAFAPSFAVLFALRIALGAAESPSFPAAAQAVQRALPPRHRAAGFGLLFTGSSIGAMIAAPLAIALNHTLGWRFAFIGTAAVGLLWVPLWMAISHAPGARAMLSDPRAGAAGPTPAAGEGAHGVVELARLMAVPSVQRALLLVLATAPAVNFVFNWLPKYLVAERGLTQDALAAYLWLPPVFFDAGAVAFGVLASVRARAAAATKSGGGGRGRWGLVAVGGLFCSAIGCMPLATGAAVAVALASLSLLGAGACFALLTSDMLSRVDTRYVSRAGGLTAAAQSLAYIVANLVIGAVVERTQSFGAVIVVLGVIVVPGTVAWVAWPLGEGTSDVGGR